MKTRLTKTEKEQIAGRTATAVRTDYTALAIRVLDPTDSLFGQKIGRLTARSIKTRLLNAIESHLHFDRGLALDEARDRAEWFTDSQLDELVDLVTRELVGGASFFSNSEAARLANLALCANFSYSYEVDSRSNEQIA